MQPAAFRYSGAWTLAIQREGIRVADLSRIHGQNVSRPEYPAEAVALLDQLDPNIAWRALWLLRQLAEEDRLGGRELAPIVERVDSVDHWIWRLLICQLFGRVTCPAELRDDLYPFLENCLKDRRVIVRAWAISAMWRFRDDRRFRSGILRARGAAQKDPAKSMGARLRALAAMG